MPFKRIGNKRFKLLGHDDRYAKSIDINEYWVKNEICSKNHWFINNLCKKLKIPTLWRIRIYRKIKLFYLDLLEIAIEHYIYIMYFFYYDHKIAKNQSFWALAPTRRSVGTRRFFKTKDLKIWIFSKTKVLSFSQKICE